MPLLPNTPVSLSLAVIIVTRSPGNAVSSTDALYASTSNFGELSLASVISIVTVAVEDNFCCVSVSSAITWKYITSKLNHEIHTFQKNVKFSA